MSRFLLILQQRQANNENITTTESGQGVQEEKRNIFFSYYTLFKKCPERIFYSLIFCHFFMFSIMFIISLHISKLNFHRKHINQFEFVAFFSFLNFLFTGRQKAHPQRNKFEEKCRRMTLYFNRK